MVTLQFIIKQWENLTVQCEILLCPVMGERRTTVQAVESTGDWTKHNEIWATYLYYIFVMLISAFNNVKHTPFGNSTRVQKVVEIPQPFLCPSSAILQSEWVDCNWQIWSMNFRQNKVVSGWNQILAKTSRKRLEKSFWIKRNASYFRLRR